MKPIFLIFLSAFFNTIFLSFTYSQSNSSMWSSEALVWRGFSFSWDETNHRMASFIIKPELFNQSDRYCKFSDGICDEDSGYKFHIMDAPRFGTQAKNLIGYLSPPDKFQLNSQATYIQSDSEYLFHDTSVVFENVLDEHNNRYHSKKTIKIPLPKNKKYLEVESFIKGIMIESIRDASKLKKYTCEVKSLIENNDSISIEIELYASFGCENPGEEFNRKNCECSFIKPFINKKRIKEFECTDSLGLFQYKITVPILVILSNYKTKILSLKDNSSWETSGGKCFNKVPKKDNCETIVMDEKFLKSKVKENFEGENIDKKIIGIKKIGINLDKESHIYRWESFFFIEDSKIKSLQLFNPSPFGSVCKKKVATRNLSFASKGSAEMIMELGIIEGAIDGEVKHLTTKRTRSYSRKQKGNPYCACDTENTAKVEIFFVPFDK